jgi:hypothetical protein
MSLLGKPTGFKALGDRFFHCDKAKGGCGHISRYCNSDFTGCNPRPGPWPSEAAAWILKTCTRCGKPVEIGE